MPNDEARTPVTPQRRRWLIEECPTGSVADFRDMVINGEYLRVRILREETDQLERNAEVLAAVRAGLNLLADESFGYMTKAWEGRERIADALKRLPEDKC